MKRVRSLMQQICPALVVSSAEHPERVHEPTDAELRAQTSMLLKYRAGVEQLMKDGTPPDLCGFDIALASPHGTRLTMETNESIGTRLDKSLQAGDLNAMELLPGPWHEAHTWDQKVALIQQVNVAQALGHDIQTFADWQLKYGKRGLSSNIAIPTTTNHGIGMNPMLGVTARVVVADPADAERLARMHTRKEANFRPILFDSIISTTDNEHWRKQREHLVEAFLPVASLSKILPISLARAKHCAQRLAGMSSGGEAVDMSDFLLHEAQAQLQLALLGGSEEIMEKTNERIRAGFMSDPSRATMGDVGSAMQLLTEASKKDPLLSLPSDCRPVHGPLWRAVHTSGVDPASDYGNVLLILFAGHDTTGHTMTWLLFELARHLEIQQALRKEVKDFFEKLDGHDPTYADLSETDLLDRCITETLRLWPAVASGTYRQLQFDDTVTGPDGEQVTLPKGTCVNIVNWSRHRNREIWGDDADVFNPSRVFRAGEVAKVGCPMAAMSPQSDRFSPFAHNPRSCLGKNFAQMEMRLILLYLLRDFHFELAPPYDALAGRNLGAAPLAHDFRGINRGTMGPMDLERLEEGHKPYYALKMYARSDHPS